MNRQYIGARYVPKFSNVNNGVWDNTYTYEALEIVKHGNDYYTSRKPVPTGIAITNTDYWVLTGNYSGAIDHLQDQIDDIDDTIGDHTTGLIKSVDDVWDEVNNLNNNIIPGIDTQIQNIISDMVDVQEGPHVYSGSADVSDNNIHTVGSVTLEAGKLYMIFSKCDFEIAANSSNGVHYIEQELTSTETPSVVARGRLTWSGNIVQYTSISDARTVSVSNVYIYKPTSNTTLYLHFRDYKSVATTVTAYPSIQAINFD